MAYILDLTGLRLGWALHDHHWDGSWFQVHQILPSFPVLPQNHPAQELVMRAVTLFGNLQSFMKQALDQAVATQALWHGLSSRLRVSLGLWDSRGSGLLRIGCEAVLGGLSCSMP